MFWSQEDNATPKRLPQEGDKILQLFPPKAMRHCSDGEQFFVHALSFFLMITFSIYIFKIHTVFKYTFNQHKNVLMYGKTSGISHIVSSAFWSN